MGRVPPPGAASAPTADRETPVLASDLLHDAIGRLPALVQRTAAGLGPDELAHRPTPRANSIAWLLWHLTRVQDHHVAEILGEDQVWAAGEWPDAFGLPADPTDTGYGHTPEQVAAVRVDGPEPLVGYHRAVTDRTIAYLSSRAEGDLDRIIDRSYDPPVSVGVRLTSVVGDSLQHVGQAAYVRGLLAAGR